MKTNYLINNDIAVFTLNPEDKEIEELGIKFLQLLKKSFSHFAIFDLSLFDIVCSEDISFIEKLVNILKLNNIEVIVCNFNVYSASILFYFIDKVSFKTELDVQRAIDAINSYKKK